MELIAHPLYLAPIPLYARLYASEAILFDGDSSFVKQTFRNRAIIATENGTQTLTIPVIHNGRQAMRDVRISEHGNWRHLHWNAIVTAYKKSPFFDYYADDFAHFYEEKDNFLMDFNLRLHDTVCNLLALERRTEELKANTLLSETPFDARLLSETKEVEKTESTQEYYQVFSQRNGFIPNLSIADLLFNMGPEGLIVLQKMAEKLTTRHF